MLVQSLGWEDPLEKGTPPGEGNGHPLQYSYLDNSMDRGTWLQSMGLTQSWAWLSDTFSMMQWVLTIWSLIPLPFLNPACTFGSSQFMYCWSLASSFGSTSFGVTDPFLWDFMNARLCLCPPRLEALFTPVLWKPCNQIPLAFTVRFPGKLQSLCWVQGWEACGGVQNLHNSWGTYLVLLFSNFSVTHQVGLGCDFIMIVPLLLFHCSFFFVFGRGVSFLVGSSVLVLMVVQQLVLILVLSPEEMNQVLLLCHLEPEAITLVVVLFI